MWALIQGDKIKQIITYPTNIEIDNVKHSSKIFNAWTWDELNAIGIYQVIPASRGDDRFEQTTNQTFTFDASKKQVTMSYTITDKPLNDAEAKDSDGKNILDEDGNKVINYGLKTMAIAQAKKEADMLIKRFNWLVERSIYDSSKAIPDAVKTYVTAIRNNAATIETAITNASDMDAFKALYVEERNSDGSIKTQAKIYDWTSDSTVTDYIR